jgi:hypothetical protein
MIEIPLRNSTDDETCSVCEFYLEDDRYSVPTLRIMMPMPANEAVAVAYACLEENAHYRRIEVWIAGACVASLTRSEMERGGADSGDPSKPFRYAASPQRPDAPTYGLDDASRGPKVAMER